MSVPGKRNRISDDQRSILETFYYEGMVETGSFYKAKIDRAIDETGLTEVQVKKWIGNQKRMKKMEQNDSAHGSLGNTLKRAKATRGPSAYNLFCGDFFKRDDCKDLSYAEKSEMAATEWKQINTQDKENYERLSLSFKTVKVDELTDVQKNKLIARHTKRLVEETMILADLGCEISTLAVDMNGKVFQTGSSDGNQFLSSNPEIGIKFRGYFGESNRSYNRNDVQNLFNRKYGEAIGKICRVPYLKGGFEVIGMPEGIEFKKPYNYGAHQIKKIMEAADDISFFIQDPEELLESNTPSSSTVTSNANMESIKRLLERIAGSESADKVLENAREKIPEEDVEVVNLDLTEDEKFILYANCEKYFSPDGWLAVGHNMQHSSSSKDLLLPVYTEAEEKFWLFLVNEKPSRIAKSVFTTKIKGRWLNLEANGQYSILNEWDSILGKNIIRTAHGPLYLGYCHGSHGNYELPDASKNAILEILNNTGFVQTIYRQA